MARNRASPINDDMLSSGLGLGAWEANRCERNRVVVVGMWNVVELYCTIQKPLSAGTYVLYLLTKFSSEISFAVTFLMALDKEEERQLLWFVVTRLKYFL